MKDDCDLYDLMLSDAASDINRLVAWLKFFRPVTGVLTRMLNRVQATRGTNTASLHYDAGHLH